MDRQRIDGDRDIVLPVPLFDEHRPAARDRSVRIDVPAGPGIQREVVPARGNRAVERDVRAGADVQPVAVDQHVAGQCDGIVERDRPARREDVGRRRQHPIDQYAARSRTDISRRGERRAVRRRDVNRVSRRDRLRCRERRRRRDRDVVSRIQRVRRGNAACCRNECDVITRRHRAADRGRSDARHRHIGSSRQRLSRVKRRVGIGGDVSIRRRHGSRQSDVGTGRSERDVVHRRHRTRGTQATDGTDEDVCPRRERIGGRVISADGGRDASSRRCDGISQRGISARSERDIRSSNQRLRRVDVRRGIEHYVPRRRRDDAVGVDARRGRGQRHVARRRQIVGNEDRSRRQIGHVVAAAER